MKEAHVGQGGAYGFVQLESRDDALRACFDLDGVELFGQGRPIRVRPAHLNSTINVKDIPFEIGNKALAEAFKMFGDIARAVVAVDEKGHPLGERSWPHPLLPLLYLLVWLSRRSPLMVGLLVRGRCHGTPPR